MGIKTILVPYEGSKMSRLAFDTALDMAKSMNSKLLLFDCINTSFGKSLIPKADFDFESIVLEKLKNKAKKDIKNLERLAKKKGVKLESFIVGSSSIANSILSFSKSHKVDLIVMGAHSKSRIAELFLGSVSNAVLHRAKVPVMIVR